MNSVVCSQRGASPVNISDSATTPVLGRGEAAAPQPADLYRLAVLRVDYLRPGRGNHFIATGRVMRLGNRIAVTHMELVNDAGELTATGSAAYVVG